MRGPPSPYGLPHDKDGVTGWQLLNHAEACWRESRSDGLPGGLALPFGGGLAEHRGDHFAFGDEFVVCGFDFSESEGVHLVSVHDFVAAGGGGFDWEASPDFGVESVGPVRFDGDGVDGSWCGKVADVVNESAGSGGRR